MNPCKGYLFVLSVVLVGALQSVAQITPSISEDYFYQLNDRDISEDRSCEVSIDITSLIEILRDAPHYKKERNERGIDISIPLADGTRHIVSVHEAPVSAPSHYQKYPDNRTFKITGSHNKQINGRFALSPRGMRALLYTHLGTVLIEPIADTHVAYLYSHNTNNTFTCGMQEESSALKRSTDNIYRSMNALGDELRDYRIAIASSGEWSNERNNDLTTINDDINTYLAALNAIYEREISTTFTLIADNDDIIFFNPATDGIDPNNKTSSAHSTINSTIGAANYDIGHVFYEIDYNGSGATGSGIAGLGVACKDNRKGEGWTGLGGNYSVSFFLGILAHEVGHQLDAAHTFYGTAGFDFGPYTLCEVNRSTGSGYEPGSGSTLMSYQGNCGQSSSCSQDQNIYPDVNTVYFNAHSLEQMYDYMNLQSCYGVSNTGNSAPIVTMPVDKTIPKETPFTLEGSATDADGDLIYYSWEQYDSDNLVLACPDGDPEDAATSSTAPLFRSFDPATDGDVRTFPQIDDILTNTTTIGEILPEVDRDINFRLTARDLNVDNGGSSHGEMTLTVEEDAGPFEVTVANTGSPAYQAGDPLTVTWSVNNTNIPPISCTNVKILWSNDGGYNFNVTLATSTTNDGSHAVTLPSNGTSQGRIKVEAIGNYFFDINDKDITIISDCVVDAGEIINDETVTADAGDAALVLNVLSGIKYNNINSELATSTPTTNLNCENSNTGGCSSFGNMPRYETFTMVPSTTGDYTFARSSSYFSIINLYDDEHDPNNVCDHWIASSAVYNPSTGSVSIGSSATETLTALQEYEMKFSAFYGSSIGTYTVSLSNSVGGDLYDTDKVEPAGYVHEYVIVDGSNQVKSISSFVDLSDDTIYPGGTYIVYGLSYLSSQDLSGYVNGSYTTLSTDVNVGTICGDFTSNTKEVIISGCTPSTKVVTSTSDNGSSGTLRSQIANACPGDMITFSGSIPNNTTINLNSDIVVDRSITIDGSNVSGLKIAGGFTTRMFTIPTGQDITFKDLSLINGAESTNGGAFFNEGTVTLDGVTFQNNFDGGNISPYTGDGEIIITNGVTTIKD